MLNVKSILLLLFINLIMISSLSAQEKQGKYFVDDNNVANSGYDVVAYFTDYKAVKGSKNHSAQYDGVTYYFTSDEHKTMFEKDPVHYLPQYGGYCAFGMAKMNSKVPANPETFIIYNGKLYLFFNDLYEGKKFNTIVPWNRNESNLKTTADNNWKAMN
jgi:YHS domain-containing protein